MFFCVWFFLSIFLLDVLLVVAIAPQSTLIKEDLLSIETAIKFKRSVEGVEAVYGLTESKGRRFKFWIKARGMIFLCLTLSVILGLGALSLAIMGAFLNFISNIGAVWNFWVFGFLEFISGILILVSGILYNVAIYKMLKKDEGRKKWLKIAYYICFIFILVSIFGFVGGYDLVRNVLELILMMALPLFIPSFFICLPMLIFIVFYFHYRYREHESAEVELILEEEVDSYGENSGVAMEEEGVDYEVIDTEINERRQFYWHVHAQAKKRNKTILAFMENDERSVQRQEEIIDEEMFVLKKYSPCKIPRKKDPANKEILLLNGALLPRRVLELRMGREVHSKKLSRKRDELLAKSGRSVSPLIFRKRSLFKGHGRALSA